jgi:prepilin-type N-terminal cleavage/methylation domain-containing protein
MTLVARLRTLRSQDGGFTLIEMLVASVLFVVVGSVIAGIFISSLNVQQTVSGVSASTNTAQSAASSIDQSIRNASGYALTSVGSDQLLVARVAGTGTSVTWSCVAWYYSASTGQIRSTRGAVGTKITTPTSSALATWTLLTGAVTARSGSTIFTDVDGTTLNVAFDVTGAGKKVAMQFSASRPIGVASSTLTESEKCY